MRFDILEKLGIKYEDFQLYFNISESSVEYINKWLESNNLKEYITFSPGSPVPRKMWSLGKYAELADLIQDELRIPVVLVWGPKEEEIISSITSKMKTKPLIAPPTDLQQLGALIKKTQLLICNDGGINHLAVATKTNTLAIFGATSVEAWSPASVFKTHYHMKGDPNNNQYNDFGLKTTDVIEKVKEILNK
jgi:ADP-heptose:LPS heptosyltransferase